eukprot:scaffold75505_cov34-Prasinocladus_malaysianus.AAC.2
MTPTKQTEALACSITTTQPVRFPSNVACCDLDSIAMNIANTRDQEGFPMAMKFVWDAPKVVMYTQSSLQDAVRLQEEICDDLIPPPNLEKSRPDITFSFPEPH